MRQAHHLFFLTFSLLALALAGCSSSIEIGTDDGGTSSDAGPRSDGSNGEPCGANTCSDGTYCCNASCGICAPEGGGCITLECTEPVVCGGEACSEEGAVCCPGCFPGEAHCSAAGGACPPIRCAECRTSADCGPESECCTGCDPAGAGVCSEPGTPCPDLFCGEPCGSTSCGAGDQCCPSGCPGVADYCAPADEMCAVPDCPAPSCEPMQAYGLGSCLAFFGYRWNGSFCEGVSGCDCVGADCGRTYASPAECEANHGACGSQPGCTRDLECPEQFYCNDCARGSCMGCEDCVSDCAPLPCGSEGEAACDEVRPECGPGGVAIVRDGCWVCVDRHSCEDIDATDCRITGCPAGEACEPCWVGHACIPEGAVC